MANGLSLDIIQNKLAMEKIQDNDQVLVNMLKINIQYTWTFNVVIMLLAKLLDTCIDN